MFYSFIEEHLDELKKIMEFDKKMCQIVPYICPPKDLCVLCEFLPLQVAIVCIIEKMQLTQPYPPLSSTSDRKVVDIGLG